MHTEGPWRQHPHDPSKIDAYPHAGHIAEALTYADTKLIAAAPELLEALEMANELIPQEVRARYQVPMLKIKAAIAKAKGE